MFFVIGFFVDCFFVDVFIGGFVVIVVYLSLFFFDFMD